MGHGGHLGKLHGDDSPHSPSTKFHMIRNDIVYSTPSYCWLVPSTTERSHCAEAHSFGFCLNCILSQVEGLHMVPYIGVLQWEYSPHPIGYWSGCVNYGPMYMWWPCIIIWNRGTIRCRRHVRFCRFRCRALTLPPWQPPWLSPWSPPWSPLSCPLGVDHEQVRRWG